MKLLIVTQKVDENDQLLGFFIEWLRRLAQKFDKLTVLCLEKGKYNLSENVEVVSLGKDKGASKLKILARYYMLLTVRSKDYDAVFVHMNPIWMVLGGLCWKIMGKKRFLWYTSGGITLKLKIAEKFADKIFTASAESFRVPSKKIIVTGHGIDTNLFTLDLNQGPQTTSHRLKLLSVGRIAPVKNYETLIEAAKILRDKNVDFSVTMIGEAPLLEKDQNYALRIKNKIKELGLENNFNFVGKINHKELPQYYQSHGIFIHLSKTGSLDKTILEAMACGIKVLSSNDASKSFLPTDLIFDGENSQELADKILKLKDINSDPNLRDYVVRNHNLENLIDKISQYISR